MKIEKTGKTEKGQVAAKLDRLYTQAAAGNSDALRYMQVRREVLRDLAASGGVARSMVFTQLLYLLPDEFVVAYEDLFEVALGTDGGARAVSGAQTGIEKGKGQTQGVVLGSDNRLQAGGGGKKWKERRLPLGSEAGLKLKTAVDKELMSLASKITGELTALAQRNTRAGMNLKCKGAGCGRFLKAEYRFCPRCGTRVS